jgi:hypothetical protein
MPALALTKNAAIAQRAQVVDFGGERGTRTLDPGIMSSKMPGFRIQNLFNNIRANRRLFPVFTAFRIYAVMRHKTP